jgi:hypothetical protein
LKNNQKKKNKENDNNNNRRNDDSIVDRTVFKNNELDNIAKDLMVLQFRTEKLGSRLVKKFVQYRHKSDVYYREERHKNLSSSFEFKHNGRNYKVSIDIAALD